jgi:chitodextrinase
MRKAVLCRIAAVLAVTLGLINWFGIGIVAHAATTATPKFIQEKDNQVTSGKTSSIKFSSSTTAGNLLVAYIIWDNTGSASVSDSSGNTYLSAVGPSTWPNGHYSAQVFYARNTKTGADTVKATFATNISSSGIIYALEYSGVNQTTPIDVIASAIGSSPTLNSGPATTTGANDLLFGAGLSDDNVTSAGAGFIARSIAEGNIVEDQIARSAGSYSATAPHDGVNWVMQMVAFRAATNGTPPTVPTGLTAVAVSSSQVNLTWTASTDPNYTASQLSYNCYRNGVRVVTTAAGTTACSDTGLAAATTYTYTVSAQDPAGNVSAQSAGVQATTPPLAMPVITSFTATPASIAAGQSAALSWAASNTTSLTINNGVGTVTGTSATVQPTVTTAYTLTATNSMGSTTSQASVTVTADTTPPTTPTGLTAVAISSSQINLNWTASTDNVGVAGYRLYRNGSQIATTTATSYSDTGLSASTTYAYNVAAFDAAGNTSPQSSPASANTLAGSTQGPTVSITSPTNGQVLSGPVTITAEAADNLGVAGVQFYLDGTALGQDSTTAPYSTTWNTIQATNASHVLTAIASDTAGNMTVSSGVTVTVSNVSPRPYTTNFPLTENPISENDNWINGKATGLDWSDVQTTSGLAFGTQTGSNGYDDSTAVLAGSWGPNQTAQATVHTVNQNSGIYEEVELRLRTTVAAHNITGYEINYRCTSDGSQYITIVRWNGALGNFTYVNTLTGGPGLHNGDVVEATIVGSTITAYLNGTQMLQGTDSTFTSGSPGIGFFLQGGSAAADGDFGFTTYMASDGTTNDKTPPSVPTNLSAVGVSSSQINLSWTASTDNVGVAGYQIFRNSAQIATSTNTNFSDTGLTANTQYTYAVSAYDAAGNVSAQSTPVVGVTLQPNTTPPSVPIGLQSSNITSSTVTVSWTASTGVEAVAGYQVFRNGTQVGTTATTSYTDTGLTPSTTYSYTVAAYDFSNNVSLQSTAMVVTTAAAPQNPPSFVQANQTLIGSGTSEPLAFNSATRAGNTIVVYVIWSNTGSVALTDSLGDTFVSVSAPVSWGSEYSAQVFYASNIVGGADTVTATFRNSIGYFGNLYIHEYAGISAVNPVDVTVAAVGASAQLNSGSATTTSANDLIFGAGVSDDNVTAVGSGFAARSLAYGNVTEDEVGSSPGSYSATATHDGVVWAMQMVAFRAN